MTDQTDLQTFIEDLVSRGIRPTQGLDLYRQAGGAIRTKEWFATYREVERKLGPSSDRQDGGALRTPEWFAAYREVGAKLRLIRELERKALDERRASGPLTGSSRRPSEDDSVSTRRAVPKDAVPHDHPRAASRRLDWGIGVQKFLRLAWGSVLALIVSWGVRTAAAGKWLLGRSTTVVAGLISTASRLLTAAAALLRAWQRARPGEQARRAALWSLHALATLAIHLALALAVAGRLCVRAAQAAGRSLLFLARALLRLIGRSLSTASRLIAALAGALRRGWRRARPGEQAMRAARWSLHALAVLATYLGLALAVAGRLCVRATVAALSSAPSVSRRLLRPSGLVFLASVAGVVVLLARYHSASFLYLLYIGFCLVLGAVCWTTLVWMLDAWRSPASFPQTRQEADDLEPRFSFSLIVPARHEETVLEATLSRLASADHPDFEVLVVVGDDDPGTRRVAERVAAAHPERVRIVLDDSRPKNKPKALNAALPHCRGAVTGVFDAEDDVDPGLLRRVDQCLQKTRADVVQAGVQLMNFHSSWFAVRNVLEYYFWFRSRLHFHARQGFIPLGGNTVFVRTRVLREVGGWDPECLAEDCELGVRLSSHGAQTVVFYEPELVTREETPPTLGAFARQRTRWNQGYLQTLEKGLWRRLSLKQQALGIYTLAMPYLMAAAWLLIPAALATAVALKVPVPITLIAFLPLLPMLTVLAVEVAGLGDFCRTYGRRASIRDYARLVFGLPLYQAVLAFAAARAVAREIRGARGWEKTSHFGLHLADRVDQEDEPAKVPLAIPLHPAIRSEAVAASSGELVSLAVAGAAIGSAGSELAVGMDVPHPLGGLGAGRSREPLWTRLDPDSAHGSVVLPLPGARATAGVARVGESPTNAAADARSRTRSRDLTVLVPLLACLALVLATNMLHWPAVFFDEGTYTCMAWAVQHRGALGFYTYTYGHPPLGWITISLWTWVTGIFGHATYSIDRGRELMLVITLVSCSLLYTFARRLGIGRAFAAGAVILLALSPVSLYFHRLVLLDNLATAWALAAFVLALSPRRRLWTFAGSGACFAASVLSKETILVILPALLLAAAQNADRHTRRYCITLFASFFGLISFAYPLYATLKGELLPGRGHVSLVGSMVVQLVTRKQTGSIFDPQSLAHSTVQFWLHLDPWLVGAALLVSPVALARRNTRAAALAYLIQVAMVLRPGYLPNMYVIGLLPFAALIVAGTADALWRFTTQDPPGRRSPVGRGIWRATVSRARTLVTSVAYAVAPVALVVTAFACAVAVVPRWARADWTATTVKEDGPVRAAERWLVRHVGHDKRIILGDEYWIYLIEHGFDTHPVKGGLNSRTVVSYWQLDYDPAVKAYFPGGWRQFDYVVSNWAMRATAVYTPNTAQALKHSRLVVSFGRGNQRIEIRAIAGGQQSRSPAVAHPPRAKGSGHA